MSAGPVSSLRSLAPVFVAAATLACAPKPTPTPAPTPVGEGHLSDEERAELQALRAEQLQAQPQAEPTTSPCPNEDPACDPGSQGCPCNPGQQCDGSMTCERGECIDRAGKGLASWRPPALTSQNIRVGLDTIQDRLRECECAHPGQGDGLKVEFIVSGAEGRVLEVSADEGGAASDELRECVATATRLASFETFQHTCQHAYFKPRLGRACG